MGYSDYPEDKWLSLSGIQHFSFCKRQWALIHIEQQWQENALTTAGMLEHDRAHDYNESETRGNLLIMRDLKVFSRKLGITGACDVVEFHRTEDGVEIHGRKGKWCPYPIEYKHGRPKAENADRLQLCAEAMCLEEMLACTISEGALFYQGIKRREYVQLDQNLREQVSELTRQMHELFERGTTPKVKPKKACSNCSLREICLLTLLKKPSVEEYICSHIDDLFNTGVEG